MNYFSSVWKELLLKIFTEGQKISPRGRETYEIQHYTSAIDMCKPVLLNERRKLSYKFMAAEAYWILSGDSKVASIEKYNPNIKNFSDDGVNFYGAYGPKIISQLNYVIEKLKEDESTRQAGLTIWRENPPQTKDVPCTVAIFFSIRNNKLNAHVFMRSSDVWLGMPYDVFNFSMLSCLVCSELNQQRTRIVQPGQLFLTAASLHLYRANLENSLTCADPMYEVQDQRKIPEILYTKPSYVIPYLSALRDSSPGDAVRWWESV